MQYDWPGNVRELENCIERAVALGSQDSIDIADLPPALQSQEPWLAHEEEVLPHNGDGAALGDTDLEALERTTIQRVFEQVNGDKALARKMLGISRATLYRKLKRYNIAVARSDGSVVSRETRVSS